MYDFSFKPLTSKALSFGDQLAATSHHLNPMGGLHEELPGKDLLGFEVPKPLTRGDCW